MNIQFVIHGGRIYVLEVNPRSSRTVPVPLQDHRRADGRSWRRG